MSIHKKSKLLALAGLPVLLLSGCGSTVNFENAPADSSLIQSSNQGNVVLSENSDSDKALTESYTDDKARIEQKVREMKGITDDNIRAMRWSPDGSELIFAIGGGEPNYTVYLWEVSEEYPQKANIDTGWGAAFGWCPNSKYVLVEGGTAQIKSVTIMNKFGEYVNDKSNGEPLALHTAGIAHPNMELAQFWSSDSTKFAIAEYNNEITVFPDAEVSGVFDIVVYDVEDRVKQTVLQSTATQYYIIEQWSDSNTINCSLYAPKNNELGEVVEKDIKISCLKE